MQNLWVDHSRVQHCLRINYVLHPRALYYIPNVDRENSKNVPHNRTNLQMCYAISWGSSEGGRPISSIPPYIEDIPYRVRK